METIKRLQFKKTRRMLDFARKVVFFIFYPGTATYNLVNHLFDSVGESIDPPLKLGDGVKTGDVMDIKNNYKTNWLYVTVDNNRGIIIFFLNGKESTQRIKTIIGVLCIEIIKNNNEPVSENEISKKTDGLYSAGSLYTSSDRYLYDARRKFNEKIQKEIEITQDLIVKTDDKKYYFNKTPFTEVTLCDL